MEPAEEPAQDLSNGRLPHEPGRPEGVEDQALQDLRDPLCQGSERRLAHPPSGGEEDDSA